MGVVDPIYTAIFYCRNHGFANALEAFVQDRPGSTKTKNCLTKLHVSSPTKINRKRSLVFFGGEHSKMVETSPICFPHPEKNVARSRNVFFVRSQLTHLRPVGITVVHVASP